MFTTRLKYTTHLEQKQIMNFSSFLLFYSHLHLIGWNPKIDKRNDSFCLDYFLSIFLKIFILWLSTNVSDLRAHLNCHFVHAQNDKFCWVTPKAMKAKVVTVSILLKRVKM